MKIEKHICAFNNNSKIYVVYTNNNFKAGDTEVAIYNSFKISILLTEGINAVIGNSVIGGNKGDILFFRPEEFHFGRFLKSGSYSYLDIFIPTDFFDNFIKDVSQINFFKDTSTHRRNCIHFDVQNQKNILRIASDITEYIEKANCNTQNLKLFSLILQIVLLCEDLYYAETLKPVNYKIPDIAVKAINFITENYERKISLNEIASVSHCSTTYLSRIFKQYLGITVYNYITAVRIANAQILLREGKSVTEAGFLSGFNDCSNFAIKFKKATGSLPLEFKMHFK